MAVPKLLRNHDKWELMDRLDAILDRIGDKGDGLNGRVRAFNGHRVELKHIRNLD